jgi:hypothetical protein
MPRSPPDEEKGESRALSPPDTARRRVVVSFPRHGRSQVLSFPRRRESTAQAIGNTLPTDWIPAFAGMTSVSKGIPLQMTPLHAADPRNNLAPASLELITKLLPSTFVPYHRIDARKGVAYSPHV